MNTNSVAVSMLILMQGQKFIPKFKHKEQPPDTDTVLQKVIEATNKFERALGIARDQAIEGTQVVTQYTAIKANNIHLDVKKYGGEVGEVHGHMKQLTVGATYVKKTVDENAMLLKSESEKNELFRRELQSDSLADKIAGALHRKQQIAAQGTTRGICEHAMQNDQLVTRNELLELLSEVWSK